MLYINQLCVWKIMMCNLSNNLYFIDNLKKK
jgi:hypothetical protein